MASQPSSSLAGAQLTTVSFFQVTVAVGSKATLADIVVQWRGSSPTQLLASHPSSAPRQVLHVGPH